MRSTTTHRASSFPFGRTWHSQKSSSPQPVQFTGITEPGQLSVQTSPLFHCATRGRVHNTVNSVYPVHPIPLQSVHCEELAGLGMSRCRAHQGTSTPPRLPHDRASGTSASQLLWPLHGVHPGLLAPHFEGMLQDVAGRAARSFHDELSPSPGPCTALKAHRALLATAPRHCSP